MSTCTGAVYARRASPTRHAATRSISSTLHTPSPLTVADTALSYRSYRRCCASRMSARLLALTHLLHNSAKCSARNPRSHFATALTCATPSFRRLCHTSSTMSGSSQASPASPATLQPNGSQLNGHGKHSSSASSRTASSFHIATRLSAFTAPTVWHEFTPLAASTKAINLGQGFPGFSPPHFVKDAAARAVSEQGYDFLISQYARSAGHLPLTQRLAEQYKGQSQQGCGGHQPADRGAGDGGGQRGVCVR